ncbi:unnamed protein product, partial [Urochloa humidicola]
CLPPSPPALRQPCTPAAPSLTSASPQPVPYSSWGATRTFLRRPASAPCRQLVRHMPAESMTPCRESGIFPQEDRGANREKSQAPEKQLEPGLQPEQRWQQSICAHTWGAVDDRRATPWRTSWSGSLPGFAMSRLVSLAYRFRKAIRRQRQYSLELSIQTGLMSSSWVVLFKNQAFLFHITNSRFLFHPHKSFILFKQIYPHSCLYMS